MRRDTVSRWILFIGAVVIMLAFAVSASAMAGNPHRSQVEKSLGTAASLDASSFSSTP